MAAGASRCKRERRRRAAGSPLRLDPTSSQKRRYYRLLLAPRAPGQLPTSAGVAEVSADTRQRGDLRAGAGLLAGRTLRTVWAAFRRRRI